MSNNQYQEAVIIANNFKIKGQALSAESFGSGHINDTFKIITDDSSNVQYLLQKINHHIFSNVSGLMNNIRLVLDHLKAKYEAIEINSSDSKTLTLVPSLSGDTFLKDSQGNYWRMFILLQGTKSYDIVETRDQAFAGGKAFGEFQTLLADLNTDDLVEILPNFHNIQFRMDNLRKAIENDSANRVTEVQDILSFVMEREEVMSTILNMGNEGKLPLRITHNDTKFNNILLDKDDNVQCVIDLDTVMPGYVAYDFGDAIRTIINAAGEDEVDLDKVVLNIPLFEAYAEGYLSEAKSFLTDNEMSSLIYGVFLLPFMQGVRFLTDYLEGDHYYKTKYAEHNLVRTKSQFKLVKELEEHREELVHILTTNIACK